MARRIHKTLRWEKQRIAERQHQLHTLSDVLYDLQKFEGLDFIDKKTWHWGCGIKFTGLTKLEFKTVKSVLPKLSKLNKSTTTSNYSLSGRFGKLPSGISADNSSQWNIAVEFAWDLPDSCKITYEDVTEKAGSNYFVENGNVMLKTKKVVIDCGSPRMESVFSDTSGTSANGNI